MSRKNRTVAYFAELACLYNADALRILSKKIGLTFKSENAVVPKNRVREVQVALGISPQEVLRRKDKNIKQVKHTLELNLSLAQPTVVMPKATKIRASKKIRKKLPLIGHVRDMFYLEYSAIEDIHYFLVKDFQKSRDPIDPPGIKSEPLLQSAMIRYKTSLGNELKYPTIELASAALLHSLILNHAFHNGNKRTALVSMLVFLDINGCGIRVPSENDLYDFIMKVGDHKLDCSNTDDLTNHNDREVWAIARWVHSNIYTKMTASRSIRFRELRSILQKYGCEFVNCSKGFIDIEREGFKGTYVYRGEGREVEVKTIQKIRRDLQLDEAHGYDFSFFYFAYPKLPQFITRYRKALDLLAKI